MTERTAELGEDRAHWEGVYSTKDPSEVSWFDPALERSLALIEEAGLGRDAAILDAGGGASALAGRLLDAGYTDITVADISATALDRARSELGRGADKVRWVAADLRRYDFGRRYDLWHDRVAFHFMVKPEDRAGYVDTLRRSLKPGGRLVVATFGPDGPERCSGLPVIRYGAERLQRELGDGFELVSSSLEDHRTPSGRTQQWLYAHLRYASAGASTGSPSERQA